MGKIKGITVKLHVKTQNGTDDFGHPVFTEENWPVCYHCERCAYKKECRHSAFIREFNAVRKTCLEHVRPQTAEMFQDKP